MRNAAAADAMGMRGALKDIWLNHASKAQLSNAEAGDLINTFGAATKSG